MLLFLYFLEIFSKFPPSFLSTSLSQAGFPLKISFSIIFLCLPTYFPSFPSFCCKIHNALPPVPELPCRFFPNFPINDPFCAFWFFAHNFRKKRSDCLVFSMRLGQSSAAASLLTSFNISPEPFRTAANSSSQFTTISSPAYSYGARRLLDEVDRRGSCVCVCVYVNINRIKPCDVAEFHSYVRSSCMLCVRVCEGQKNCFR